MGRAACTRNMNQENGGDRRLRDRGRTQRNARRLLIEFAAGCLGQQHGQHLCIERVHGRRDVEVGEEIEIVDDTPVDDDRMGTVVGHQIAAVRGEMRMVFVVDMHLLPRVGREQNQQQQSRIESFGCVAYHLSEPKIAIKKGCPTLSYRQPSIIYKISQITSLQLSLEEAFS